jgi:hypothetical protein
MSYVSCEDAQLLSRLPDFLQHLALPVSSVQAGFIFFTLKSLKGGRFNYFLIIVCYTS